MIHKLCLMYAHIRVVRLRVRVHSTRHESRPGVKELELIPLLLVEVKLFKVIVVYWVELEKFPGTNTCM